MTTETDYSYGDFSLMGLFRLEVEAQVIELNRCLLEIEQAGDDLNERANWESLMRSAHSIKGAARIVQLEPAVEIAHVLEDRFVAALEGRSPLAAQEVDVLLSGVDLLSRLSLIDEDKLDSQLSAYAVEANLVVDSIRRLTEEIRFENPERDPVAAAETIESSDVQPSISIEQPADAFVRQTVDDLSGSTLTDVSSTVVQAREASSVEQAVLATDPVDLKPIEETAGRTIRIEAENLNRLMGLAGESLVEANWLEPFGQSLLQLKRQQQNALTLLERSVHEVASVRPLHSAQGELASSAIAALEAMQAAQQMLSQQLNDLNLFSQRFSYLSDGLYREVVASHMCAFEEGTKGYSRLVRDVAKSCKKQVVLSLEGLSTQVDRDILNKLDAPLVHLMTNAVVHGIELEDQRRALGKPEVATVSVEAVHRSGMLVISVADDGAGVDVIALQQKVVEKGLTTAAIAQQMQESELLEFLFLPGFSTAESVDALAGRGYGLDLARNMAQSVGGSLRVLSKLGEGTTFQFQLPLTLSVVRSLLLEVANEVYALSLSRIERVLTIKPEQIHYSEDRPYFVMETANKDIKENVSLVCGRQLLEAKRRSKASEEIFVVVIGEAGRRYGIQVDRFVEERELVVRPLDPRLGKVPNVSAAAITERGEPILILDVADMLRSAERIAAFEGSVTTQPVSVESASLEDAFDSNTAKKVLVVDDSMTVRAMEKKLLQNRGYEVEIAVDGAEGWNAVRMNNYDLVITDVDMPRMSGIELIEQMRAYSPTQQIPVIVVSYKDREEDQMAGLTAGANYYLTKSSFHDDGLINAVVDLVGPS